MSKIGILFMTAVVSLFFTASANAQIVRFGLKGGVNLSGTNLEKSADIDISESYTGFNAGIVLNVKLILGFSLQPELIFTTTGMRIELNEDILPTKGDDVDAPTTLSHSAIELPINIQWGIRLGPIRPYVQISPYIGYSTTEGVTIGGGTKNTIDRDKLQYGMGVGGGIDIWKFQMSYRYKWDINSLDKNTTFKDLEIGTGKVRSSEISLTFFF